ncbi:MAG: hypothetical protein ACM3X7_05230 [Solirubrobacterales bacterium]
MDEVSAWIKALIACAILWMIAGAYTSSNHDLAQEDALKVCQEEIKQVEQDGFITANEEENIKSKLSLSGYTIIEVIGTREMVNTGDPVFLEICIKDTLQRGAIYKLADVRVDGVAK